MKPELAVRNQPGQVCEGHKWSIVEALPKGTVYVYLCTGEVKTIPSAGAICVDEELLCVCGSDFRPIASFPREAVYLCSRRAEAPALPPC